ncbi:MAG: hypothetical protein HQ581_03450, partial [Planctomycetes bacterium]|nr:hypothetical protein [Planctomycetota bacterium]
YLEIKKDRAISWKDIDAASLAINKGCGPYAPWIDDGFSAVPWNSLAPCFVAPLLDGGKETLFSKGTKVWTIDPKLFNPDHEEVLQKLLETGRLSAPNQKIVLQGILETDGLAAPMLKKGLQPFLDANTINEIQLRVFLANCCLDMFEAEQPELDPAQLPTCFKTEDESSSWIYAFDRQAGTLSAAAGTIDSEQVLGCPGNESHFWIKKIATFRDGTFQIDNGEVFKINDNLMPVPLQLPEDAKTIGISDLRRSYLERMSRIDMEIILKQKAYLQGRLREVIQHESDVMAEMAEMSRQSAGSAIDREELEFARLHLALAPGSKQFYTYVLAELEKLIDELREGE